MGARAEGVYLHPESVWEQFWVHCAAVSPLCKMPFSREKGELHEFDLDPAVELPGPGELFYPVEQ